MGGEVGARRAVETYADELNRKADRRRMQHLETAKRYEARRMGLKKGDFVHGKNLVEICLRICCIAGAGM